MYIHIFNFKIMNKINQLLSLIVMSAIALVSFTFPNTSLWITTYKVDTSNSSLKWKGKKVTGEHTGTINISSGNIKVDGKKITGGEFVIDMQSLSNSDLTDAESNKKLVDHLKSDDFFGTDNHATSKFVIEEITSNGNDSYNVKGDLTIKGKTNSISFPATINNNGNEILIQGNAVVDRSKFDIRYGSGSFFDNLGDKMIYDEFELDINLVAEKTLAVN